MGIIEDFWSMFSDSEWSEEKKEEHKPKTQDEQENSDNYSTLPLCNDIIIKPKKED